MRKLLIKILMRLLTRYPQAVDKISPEKELNAYLFEDPTISEDLLKSLLTGQMKRYWDVPCDTNKALGLAYKKMLDNHRIAIKLMNGEKNLARRIQKWKQLRIL